MEHWLGPLRQIYKEQKSFATTQYWPSLTCGKDDTQALLETIGQLYCGGVNVQPIVSSGTKVSTQPLLTHGIMMKLTGTRHDSYPVGVSKP